MKDYEAKGHYKEKSVAERYNNQYTEPLNLSNFRAQIVGKREEKAVVEMLKGIEAGENVLDIPCGTGRYTEILLKKGDSVTGADISDEMMEYAKINTLKYGDAQFKVADAAKLPFANNEFDGVLCIRLYQRIPKEIRVEMLKEVSRVSRKWGILFFGMKTPWLDIRQWVRNLFIRGRANNPNAITFEEMKRELDEAGLKIERYKWVFPVFASGLVVKVSITDKHE
jgi:ubiquinone/menaquinone biosynthesis C-methylase UbiE